MLGIKPSTFYAGMTGFDRVGLKLSKTSRRSLGRVWNRIPDDIRQRVVMTALSS